MSSALASSVEIICLVTTAWFQVAGKSLDQVTDMMVANSSNLIVTIRPANQGNGGTGTLLPPRRGSTSRSSQMSHASSGGVSSDVDEDEIRDHTMMHDNDSCNRASTVPGGGGVITL